MSACVPPDSAIHDYSRRENRRNFSRSKMFVFLIWRTDQIVNSLAFLERRVEKCSNHFISYFIDILRRRLNIGIDERFFAQNVTQEID